MNKSVCKYLVLALAAVFMFLVFPAKTANAYQNVYSGVCGDNISWKYEPSDKKLNIFGSGDMYDWNSAEDVPWACWKDEAISVDIDNGITSIGNYAFYGFSKAQYYHLPTNLKKIGDCAFYGNSSLEDFRFTDKVTSIGDNAFFNCTSLTSIRIPDSVTYIGRTVFSTAYSLSTIYLPHNSDLYIGSGAFSICPQLKAVYTTTESMKYSALKSISERHIHYYYDIIYTTDGHGSVNSYGKTYSYGGDYLEIIAKPDYGYTVDNVTLAYGEGKVVDFTINHGVYGFSGMPDGNQPVTVNVTFKPLIPITTQPENYVGLEGTTAKFHVEAEGEGLTYQWQLKKGSSWANLTSGGATTSTLSVKVDASKNGKIYRCLISDGNGNTVPTNEVSITVKEPSIKINSQPVSFVGPEGSTVKFTVAAEGEGLTYQWQLKKGSKWANLTSGGAATTTLSIKADASKDGKTYRCLITDVNGEELASNEVSITIKEPDIFIFKEPRDYRVPEGTTVSFVCLAEGEGITYQWQLKKGSKWADLTSRGATTHEMTIKADPSKSGKVYRCLVTNAAGEQLTSREATIIVKDPDITINTQPVSYTGHVGTKAKFTVVAEEEDLTYQWELKKGNNWYDLSSGGASTSELTVKLDNSKNGKVYRCRITNSIGEYLYTDEVTITVLGENDLPPLNPGGEDGPIVVNDPPEVIVPAANASADPAPAEEPAETQAPVEEPVQIPAPAEPEAVTDESA